MKALSVDELELQLRDLPGWQVKNNALERVITGNTYLQALDWLYAIGQLAEREDHHPDLLLEYKKLTVRFWTHTANGITRRDVDLAKLTDGVLS